nr:MAG TPA: hypothetical protein [Caudoviricetes sp.]
MAAHFVVEPCVNGGNNGGADNSQPPNEAEFKKNRQNSFTSSLLHEAHDDVQDERGAIERPI